MNFNQTPSDNPVLAIAKRKIDGRDTSDLEAAISLDKQRKVEVLTKLLEKEMLEAEKEKAEEEKRKKTERIMDAANHRVSLKRLDYAVRKSLQTEDGNFTDHVMDMFDESTNKNDNEINS